MTTISFHYHLLGRHVLQPEAIFRPKDSNFWIDWSSSTALLITGHGCGVSHSDNLERLALACSGPNPAVSMSPSSV